MEEEIEGIDIDFIAEHPIIFGVQPFDKATTLMSWGFETGEGWFPTIIETCLEIEEVVKKNKMNNFRIVQIKSKFGTIRLYVDNGNEEISELISKLHYKLVNICERTGKKK